MPLCAKTLHPPLNATRDCLPASEKLTTIVEILHRNDKTFLGVKLCRYFDEGVDLWHQEMSNAFTQLSREHVPMLAPPAT